MQEATKRGRAARAGLAAAAILAILAASASPAHAFASQLRRYPYLTDAEDTGTTVSWGTDRTVTSAAVKWGGPGESCTAHTVAGARTSITVNGVAEYQWRARITALAPDTTFPRRDELLDDVALAERLSSFLDLDVERCERVRTTYHPGRSLRALFEVAANGGTLLVSARMFAPGTSSTRKVTRFAGATSLPETRWPAAKG